MITDNFGAISDCKAKLSSDTNPNVVAITNLTKHPDVTTSTLNLPINAEVELKDYFSSKKFYYKQSGNMRRATTKTLPCKATIKFDAKVGF